jgi:hypothetical protein
MKWGDILFSGFCIKHKKNIFWHIREHPHLSSSVPIAKHGKARKAGKSHYKKCTLNINLPILQVYSIKSK